MSSLELGRLYFNHAPDIRRVLAERGVRAADLEDLCHEVFLIAGDRLDRVTHPACVRLWLRAIAWRVVSSHRRRASVRRELPAGVPGLDFVDTLCGAHDLHPPERPMHYAEHAAIFLEALDALDLPLRIPLALRIIGDLTTTDIALMSGCDRKTATKRLQIAERRVKNWIHRSDFSSWIGRPRESSPERTRVLATRARSAPARLKVFSHEPRGWLAWMQGLAVTVLPLTASVQELDRVECLLGQARDGGPFAYLSVFHAPAALITLPACKRLVKMMQAFREDIVAYASVILGADDDGRGTAIFRTLAALSRPAFPVATFRKMTDCWVWLSRSETGAAEGLYDSAALAVSAVLKGWPSHEES